MSSVTQRQLEEAVCSRNRCWRTAAVEEANVRANLGSQWRALLLDHHYSRCVPASQTVGGLCDAVVVYPQDSNADLRLVELKQSVDDAPDALPQLRKGGELTAAKLSTGLQGLDVTAEIHVRLAPRSTSKYRNTIDIGAKRVMVTARRDGLQV
jgi:hypothetical protein